jgi:hypothetical protein
MTAVQHVNNSIKPLVLLVLLVPGSPQEKKCLVPALHVYSLLGTTIRNNLNILPENISRKDQGTPELMQIYELAQLNQPIQGLRTIVHSGGGGGGSAG